MHYKAAPRAERHKQRRRWRDETHQAMRGDRRRSGTEPRRHELEHAQERMEAVLSG